MLSSKAFEGELWRGAWSLCPRTRRSVFHVVPDVPVLPETLLLVELKARERSVDLGEISQLVLADVGASLQIIRRVADDCDSCLDLPIRIEDCISQLGLQTCLASLSRRVLSRGIHQAAIEMWTHSREIAELCTLLSKDMGAAASPEEAYLVGLFHELGALPRILGWGRTIMTVSDEETIGQQLAEDCRLPQYVTDYFSELGKSRGESHWVKIVRMAHERGVAATVSKT